VAKAHLNSNLTYRQLRLTAIKIVRNWTVNFFNAVYFTGCVKMWFLTNPGIYAGDLI
jgi:hypothetical protein